MRHLVASRLSAIRALGGTSPNEWKGLACGFVDQLPQLQESAHSFVLVILIDFWLEISVLADQLGTKGLARAMMSTDLEWVREQHILNLCRRWDEQFDRVLSAAISGPERQIATKALTFIQAHLSERLTIKVIADRLEVSPAMIKASIQKVCELPIRHVIKRARLESALVRIRNGDKIEAVMLQVGWA